MFQAIALHHPRPEHVDDLLGHMERVRETVGAPPGLIELSSWREVGGTRLVAVSLWESERHFRDALPLITSRAHERPADWSEREDEVVTLVPA